MAGFRPRDGRTIANDAKKAASQFRAAYDGAAKPEFDENATLTFKQRAAFAYIPAGRRHHRGTPSVRDWAANVALAQAEIACRLKN